MNQINNNGSTLDNFVPFPREVAESYRVGKITSAEFTVYCWLRLTATPYGVSTTSLDDILNDLFRGTKKKNYINKLLLNLRRNRFLYYEDRSGRRGSFQVYFGGFKVPKGGITSIDKYFPKEVTSGSLGIETGQSGLLQSSEVSSQRLETIKDNTRALVSKLSMNGQVRGHNTDNDTNKENNTNTNSIVPFKGFVSTSSFVPKTDEEQECRDIANTLGDETMDFILGIYKKHGMGTVHTAWKIYKDNRVYKIKNKPAYFNGIVKKITNNSQSQTI